VISLHLIIVISVGRVETDDLAVRRFQIPSLIAFEAQRNGELGNPSVFSLYSSDQRTGLRPLEASVAPTEDDV
jgi:hypothetical protein